MGLLLDDFRHIWIDDQFERKWAIKNSVDLEKMEDFVSYVPKIGIDLYKLIRDEFYYFYEFDINISICLLIGAVTFPFYLINFHI